MDKTTHLFSEWAGQIVTDFGKTGKIVVAWAMASMFKQKIEDYLGTFPALYLQGPWGVGKTELGKAIVAMRRGIRMNYLYDKMQDIKHAATEYPVVFLDDYRGLILDKVSELCDNPKYPAALVVAGQEFPDFFQMQKGITLRLQKRWAGDPYQIMDFADSIAKSGSMKESGINLQTQDLEQYWREAVSHIPGQPRISLNMAILPATFRALNGIPLAAFTYDELLDACVESVNDLISVQKERS